MEDAFDVLKGSLAMWPILEIPTPVLDYLFTSVRSCNIMVLGGDLVLFLLHVKKASFTTVADEVKFWTDRVQLLPDDPTLRLFLADALYRAGDLKRSLHHIDEALKLHVNAGWYVRTTYYYRARCLPSRLDVKESSIVDWMHSVFSAQQPSREDELLVFIRYASIDDEWMPQACYSLGVYYLVEKDFARAKQFHYIAEVAEGRRAKLAVFPAIDEDSCPDKRTLKQALSGPSMVLTPADGRGGDIDGRQ